MNEQLINTLKVLLGSTIALKYKAQGHHWNVEGDDFKQYHGLFGEVYDVADGAIDPLAEWIRMLDSYAPFKLSRFIELSQIPETDVSSDAMAMTADLLSAVEIAINGFKNGGTEATNAQEYALANFFADCQGSLQKYAWQLRASLKETGE